MALSEAVTSNVTVTTNLSSQSFAVRGINVFPQKYIIFTCHYSFSDPRTGCVDTKHGIDDDIIARL